MRRILLGICVCIAGVVVAQDNLSPALSLGEGERPEVVDSIAAQDSIEIEEPLTVEADTLPLEIQEFIAELYAPEAENAPIRRAGAGTHLDSVVYTNQNGAVTKIMRYDYDEYGARYRNSTEYFDPATGQHMTSSMMSESKNGGVSGGLLNASYTWSTATDRWEGTTRTEKIYNADSKQITQVTYSWNPSYSYWTPTTTTTWVYDGSRVLENWTWTIGEVNNLKPKTRTQQEWDEATSSKVTLKIVYKGGTDNEQADGEWLPGSGGTKDSTSWQYFGSNYKQTLSESYTWNTSQNYWVGKNNGKTTWNYTNNGQYEIEKITYNWNSSTLQYDIINTAIYTEYNGTTKKADATYNYGNNSGTRNAYTGSNKDTVYTYQRANGEWLVTKMVITLKNARGNAISSGTWNCHATTREWTGSHTYNYFAADNKTQVGKTTYSFVNSVFTPLDSIVYVYIDGNKKEGEKYTWSTAENRWIMNTRIDIISGTGVSGSVNMKYTNGAWQVTSGSKEVTFTDENGYSIKLKYTCNTDSTWTLKTTSTKERTFTDSDGATVKIVYSLSLPDSIWSFKNTSCTKTRTFTDANGASITLQYSCSADSVWSLKSGSKTPLDVHDAAGHTIKQYSYYCGTDSVWKYMTLEKWEYDENNHEIRHETFKKDSIPNYRTAATYDGNTKLMDERYDYNGSSFVGNYRNEYKYNQNGDKILDVKYSAWQNNNWRVGTKDTITFDDSHRELRKETYVWNNPNWTKNFCYVSEYNAAGQKTSYIVLRNVSNDWTNYTKEEWVFDGSVEVGHNFYSWVDEDWQITSLNETNMSGSTAVSQVSETYTDGVLTSHNETIYVPGTNLEQTVEAATYNTDGSIATYELATYHYNTD